MSFKKLLSIFKIEILNRLYSFQAVFTAREKESNDNFFALPLIVSFSNKLMSPIKEAQNPATATL